MDQPTENGTNNLILFPKTVDYYQVQLTRMLETERYEEAIQLLRFLLQCKIKDGKIFSEWSSLYHWLKEQFFTLEEELMHEMQEIIGIEDQGESEQEKDEGEDELLGQYVHSKLVEDEQYTKKLLHRLENEVAIENKLLALDQLTHIQEQEVEVRLRQWLEKQEQHPLLQFKTLQSLKKMGANGNIHITRGDELVEVNIDQTPADFSDFPMELQTVLQHVVEQSEIHNPTLSYFAEQTWKELLFSVFGTKTYERLINQSKRHPQVLAAALHAICLDVMGIPETEQELESLYSIGKGERPIYKQFQKLLKNHVRSAFPVH